MFYSVAVVIRDGGLVAWCFDATEWEAASGMGRDSIMESPTNSGKTLLEKINRAQYTAGQRPPIRVVEIKALVFHGLTASCVNVCSGAS